MNHTADFLTFPPIDTTAVKPYGPAIPAVAAVGAGHLPGQQNLAVVSVEQFAVGKLRHSEPVLRALAAKYAYQNFEVSTAKGMEAAKTARQDLRENGRFAVQRVRDETKKALNDGKTAIEKEADRLIALVQPEEDRVHALIQARETALAAEKAERERVEAERVAKHRAGIETIRGYVAQAQGKTAAQITAGITALMALSFGDEWQEFRDEAAEVAIATRDALVALRDATAEREAEAARIEAQRIENERVAAEQKAEADRLAAERAAMEAERAAIAAERAAADAARMEIQRRELEADEAQERAAAALAEQQRFEAAQIAEAPIVLVTMPPQIDGNQLDALRKDAARYRWLRDQSGMMKVGPPDTANYYFTIVGEFNPLSGFLNEAIDAAMAASLASETQNVKLSER